MGISETPMSSSPDSEPARAASGPNEYEVRIDGPPSFKWSHLWEKPIINPVNLKSFTLPILNLNNPYSRVFHLSWRE